MLEIWDFISIILTVSKSAVYSRPKYNRKQFLIIIRNSQVVSMYNFVIRLMSETLLNLA